LDSWSGALGIVTTRMPIWPSSRRLAQADHSIEGIFPLREAASNVLSEAICEHDALGVRPANERGAEHAWVVGYFRFRPFILRPKAMPTATPMRRARISRCI
jgi:hypothetical protein